MSLFGGIDQVPFLSGIKSLGVSGPAISQNMQTISNASTLSTLDVLKTSATATQTMDSSSGQIPAVTSQIANAKPPSTVGASLSKVTHAVGGTLKETGRMLKEDVLPKQQTTINSKGIGKRFLSGIVFGAVVNGVKGITKVISGEYSATQALQYVAKDTVVGAISGASFVGGMNLTSVLLSKIGMSAGIPLSIATMVGGAIALVGTGQLLKVMAPGWDI